MRGQRNCVEHIEGPRHRDLEAARMPEEGAEERSMRMGRSQESHLEDLTEMLSIRRGRLASSHKGDSSGTFLTLAPEPSMDPYVLVFILE